MASEPGARSGLKAVAAAGALGGAINAALCYLQWPVHVGEDAMKFSPWIIPAGAGHGALLAALTAAGWQRLSALPAVRRGLGVIALGWLSGWLSFIPIQWYISSVDVDGAIFGASSGLSLGDALGALIWPIRRVSGPEPLYMPLQFFGFVPVAHGLLSWAAERAGRSGREATLAVWAGAGALGSLWWWIGWRPWHFSLIHGTIWGLLVGGAVWRAGLSFRAASR
jgi:hypothetical protein